MFKIYLWEKVAKEMGMTYCTLASLTGLPKQQLSQWQERKTSPTLKSAIKFSQSLNALFMLDYTVEQWFSDVNKY